MIINSIKIIIITKIYLDTTGVKLIVKKKVVLLGDNAVGKTSLIRRFVFNQFQEEYVATVGSKISMKELKIQREDETINLVLMLWDLIGREGYSALHARTLVGVHGALIAADLTREETLQSLERYWIPFLYKVSENVPIVFACNKSDLTDQFQFKPEDLVELASKYNPDSNKILPPHLSINYPTSAKDGSNVESAFLSLGHLVLAEHEQLDPVKELFSSLMATRMRRESDKTTAVGALDEIIMDFCDGFEDSRMAMIILRQEVSKVGLDINQPTKEGVLKLVEGLAEMEIEFKEEQVVNKNLEKRLLWAEDIKD
jgi:small GTP-binding protein